ncbi:MAG: ABC transporter substrate-binding protein [Bacteroidaceae bacterium]|nr:ABC transporter substrate-binding protein [Bacteroidaceae bacterium]
MRPFHPMKAMLLAAVVANSLFCSCHSKQSDSQAEEGDTIALRYAHYITLTRHDQYTRATLANPWKMGETLHTYLLVPRDEELPADLPEGTILRTPLQRAVVFTAVHCGMLKELNATDRIAGVCDLSYINDTTIIERCRSGKIADMGDAMNPDVERIISLTPDALIMSPFENSGGYGRVEQTGVPIVECADYMEDSPLARAEWIRFYGLLFGCETHADSIFSEVERTYLTLKEYAKQARRKPRVLVDYMQGASWYVPGGKSYAGTLYADAHCDYFNAANQKGGSVPLSFETVYDMAKDADVWLIKYHQQTEMTYDQLQTDYAPYTGFKAFKDRKIFGCNTCEKDYYGRTCFSPDVLLRDLLIVLHPELYPDEKPVFYTPLQ